MKIRGVSFDFYMTLIYPSNGKGRGQSYQEFLLAHHLQSDPWEHQVLYDVFEYYARCYHPEMSPAGKEEFWIDFTRLLFQRTGVSGYDNEDLGKMAGEIKSILGPEYFELFPDVRATLHDLKARGLELAVVSNWQCGLSQFCSELEILGFLSEVVASGELGSAKPDSRIFQEASRRLGLSPEEIIHVGDSLIDDVQGASEAGFVPVLLDRDSEYSETSIYRISQLHQLLEMIDPV